MESALSFLTNLQDMANSQPVLFAFTVILVMIGEGLLLVGLINLLMKPFPRPTQAGKRTG